MRFKVLTNMVVWDGKVYHRGNTVDIEENHPRLEAMVRSRQFAYEDRMPLGSEIRPLFQPETNKEKKLQVVTG